MEQPSNEKLTLFDAFRLFCGTDLLRPAMLKPFVVGNKTYATDAYTLIRCDNKNIDFKIENESTLNVEAVIPTINTSEIINIDQIDWNSLMTTDESIGDGNDIECGHCRGEGIVEDDFIYKGKIYDFEYECPVCEGSGFEEEEKQILSGNKTFGPNDLIKFKDSKFYARNFYKLKKVKDIIGEEVELISYNSKSNGVMFRIGCVEVLIMPCLSNDNAIITIE